MEYKVKLLPGTPDDNNRDYLPEIIKTTDTVVNENGNNSIVYPKGLRQYQETVADGVTDTWYEYVPATYDPQQKTPLVIGLHGGLMTGWGHAIYTSWTLVADRDGFICVFPDANPQRMWAIPGVTDDTEGNSLVGLPSFAVPAKIEDNHNAKVLLGLIELMKGKYNIDEGRIFMQGMSLGNLMTAQFVRYYGHLLAGAAGSGGPSEPRFLYDEAGKIINRAGHLAVWQSRPEKNGLPPGKNYDEFMVNKVNRFYWMYLNECEPLPQISIVGEDNFAFYQGKKADLVYLDIKNRDHGQTLDEAFLYWDYLFSGTRRLADGRIEHTETVRLRRGDDFAIAAADGCQTAWVDNRTVIMPVPAVKWQKLKYHGLNGGQKVRGEYLCVPLSFLATVFKAEYLPAEDNLTAVLRLADGRRLQFARGSIGCVIDNELRSMYCEALHVGTELLVSLEWFTAYLFNLQVTACEGVVYVTDHFAVLSANMADLLRDILKGEALPPRPELSDNN